MQDPLNIKQDLAVTLKKTVLFLVYHMFSILKVVKKRDSDFSVL
jgi:hypothetical protein